jgi:hypothetical protein
MNNNKVQFDKLKITTSKSGPIKLKNRGFQTVGSKTTRGNQISSSSKDKNQFTRVKLDRLRTRLKTKRVSEYKHPMSKWMHVAYASPKPMSSTMYQELNANIQKAAFGDTKKTQHYVIEKEVPFRVA